jgi:hypothetical protein
MKMGTKETFRTWLLAVKRMTYTKYNSLAPDAKAGIQKEYKSPIKQESRSTVIVAV